jgi:hypothetical protein
MSRVARFKIQPPSTVTVREDNIIQRFAGVYFSVTCNGRQIPMPVVEFADDGIVLRLSDLVGDICPHRVYYDRSTPNPKLYVNFDRFGTVYAVDAAAHEKLMSVKDRLPDLFSKLALQLINTPSNAVNLFTGKSAQREEFQPNYAFIEPTMKSVPKVEQVPGVIWYSTLVVPKDAQPVSGNSAGLRLRMMAQDGTSGFWRGEFYVKIKDGKVLKDEELLEKYDADVIAAAFCDLTKNLVAADAMPADASNWADVSQSHGSGGLMK